MRFVYQLVLCCTLGLWSAGCNASKQLVKTPSGKTFSFALIGDLPYFPEDASRFDRLVRDINATPDLQWVMHTGDIKTGASVCSDEYLKGRLDIFQQFTLPFILTPGDNEWTDCYRPAAGGYMPLDRLQKVRSLFFSEPGRTLGNPSMALESQASQPAYADFPEHTQWVKDGVVFSVMHVVGSQNAMLPFEGRTAADDEESSRRMQAAIVWMKAAFEKARQLDSPGIFLMIHANPGFDNRSPQSVFGAFLDVLEEETVRFGKPVVLAHGDSHYFRIDKPLVAKTSGRRIVNFTRVESFGARDVHWLRVTVDPEDENVFSFRQELLITE